MAVLSDGSPAESGPLLVPMCNYLGHRRSWPAKQAINPSRVAGALAAGRDGRAVRPDALRWAGAVLGTLVVGSSWKSRSAASYDGCLSLD